MEKGDIRVTSMKKYVNAALFAFALFFAYIFIFHSFSLLFWTGAVILFVVLVGMQFFLSKEGVRLRSDTASVERSMQGAARKLSFEYQTRSAPRYHPLFESTELTHTHTKDPIEEQGPKEFKEVEHYIRGKADGEHVEGFVQEAELDLGMGPVRKNYIAVQTDVEKVFSDIKFFITPRSRKKGVAGFIHRISQNPFAGAIDFRQVRTESPSFAHQYAVWVRRYDNQDEKMVFQILTPEFIRMILDYKEPLYIEVVYDRLRIYHDIFRITADKMENIIRLLVHMKRNITRHPGVSR